MDTLQQDRHVERYIDARLRWLLARVFPLDTYTGRHRKPEDGE